MPAAHSGLTVIEEKTTQKRKKLDQEVMKKFKQHMINKDFFTQLKMIMYEID